MGLALSRYSIIRDQCCAVLCAYEIISLRSPFKPVYEVNYRKLRAGKP